MEKIKVKKIGEYGVQITMNNVDFSLLKEMVEHVYGLSEGILHEIQSSSHWAYGDQIKKRPDMAKDYLAAMNFTDKCLRVLGENRDFAPVLYSALAEVEF